MFKTERKSTRRKASCVDFSDEHRGAELLYFFSRKIKSIAVKMDGIKVMPTNRGRFVLETSGAGPCICIILKGSVDGQPFLLMDHWTGLNVSSDAP